MVRNKYATSSDANAVLVRPLRLATGTVLPTLGKVSLAPGAPFDWGELTLGVLMLALALGSPRLAATLRTPRNLWPRLLRLGAVPLLLAGCSRPPTRSK